MNRFQTTSRQWWRAASLACFGLLLPFTVDAALPSFVNATPVAGGGQAYSLNLELLILLTSLTFLPAVVLMMTSFTRIIIVLSLFRMALGTQGTPPNQVLVGLALFLTLFVMSPVLDKIYTEAYQPLSENKISMMQAVEIGSGPLKEFMLRQTRQADLALYLKLSNGPALESEADVPFQILVPAFVTSELKTAFQIGFAIFIPFLIIDMVVASVLMAMGMMMVSPSIVSLPFKIMLFVLVDGWQLLLGSLGQSFG
jgi:flagellar biosynthetic protein FliP